jgi:hypothetical protein
MPDSPLNAALRPFEATEANLTKAEHVLREIDAAIPSDIVCIDDADYAADCRSFDTLLAALPMIDGWKPDIKLMRLEEIARSRSNARDKGEVKLLMSAELQIGEPARLHVSPVALQSNHTALDTHKPAQEARLEPPNTRTLA